MSLGFLLGLAMACGKTMPRFIKIISAFTLQVKTNIFYAVALKNNYWEGLAFAILVVN